MNKFIISLFLMLTSLSIQAQKVMQDGVLTVKEAIRFMAETKKQPSVDEVVKELKANGYLLLKNEDDDLYFGKNVKKNLKPIGKGVSSVIVLGSIHENDKGKKVCMSTSIYVYNQKTSEKLVQQLVDLGAKKDSDTSYSTGYQDVNLDEDGGRYDFSIHPAMFAAAPPED